MNNNSSVKWPVVISIVVLLAGGFAWTNTKADKSELKDTEARIEKKIDRLQDVMKSNSQEVKDSVLRMEGKIYELLRDKRREPQ